MVRCVFWVVEVANATRHGFTNVKQGRLKGRLKTVTHQIGICLPNQVTLDIPLYQTRTSPLQRPCRSRREYKATADIASGRTLVL